MEKLESCGLAECWTRGMSLDTAQGRVEHIHIVDDDIARDRIGDPVCNPRVYVVQTATADAEGKVVAGVVGGHCSSSLEKVGEVALRLSAATSPTGA
jgi:hypothetical protein